MASAAQFEANRLNAALSTGPASPEGKARSSRNHLKFGLFSTQNCVRPEETQEYTRLSKALWKDLNPVGPVEQMLAVEIVRAAWRLHRCAIAEAEDGETPATQASIDRARASAHNSLRRLLNDLRQFQSDRWLRAEILRDGFDEAYYGIADAHRVIKGLADDSRLKSQTIQTQLFGQVRPAVSPANVGQTSPVAPAVFAAGESSAPTNRTQLVGQVGPAVSSANVVPPATSRPWLPVPGPWTNSSQRSLPLQFRPEIQALLRRGSPARLRRCGARLG
jgi:hypothetical protein